VSRRGRNASCSTSYDGLGGTVGNRSAVCWRRAHERPILASAPCDSRPPTVGVPRTFFWPFVPVTLSRRHARATRPCVLPLFARVYIDPCGRSRRRRPQALGVLGGSVCPRQAISSP